MAEPIARGGTAAEGIVARWRDWWRRYNEIGSVDRAEVERVAGDFGLSGQDLQDLVAQGPRAADLLYERLAALGLAGADIEQVSSVVMRDLQKACIGCADKAVCRRDLAARPDDPAWKGYCPNSAVLESIGGAKDRAPR